MRDVAIIGAGFIATAHAKALQKRKDMRVSAVVDPSFAAAETLAKTVGAPKVFASIDDLLARARPDAAHVLTPPHVHAQSATPILKAGVDVLVEKPMAATSAECRAMLDAAAEGGASLSVNHNFTHHPVFLRLQKALWSGRFGPARQIQARYAAPLRQMTARQFGHWMFSGPLNLLLEQAVHPLSQIDALMGPIENVIATPGAVRRPADGLEIVTDWSLDLACKNGNAQLQIVLGAAFPSWTMSVLCDDGVIDADIFEGRVTTRRAHAAIAQIDMPRRNLAAGVSAVADSARALAGFAAELLRLDPPSDGFSRSMAASVNAFHDTLGPDEKQRDDSGPRLVSICEKAAATAHVRAPKQVGTPGEDAAYDVAVIGGTGFIGQHLVKQLVEKGRRVAVMSRNVNNLPSLFHDERVGVYCGSMSDNDAVADLCRRTRQIVNLAHGGGGASREAISRNMVSGADMVARAAGDAGVERLIYVSSSAALYLGDETETITAATPVDPEPDKRADYACAKILSENAAAIVSTLPTVVMRPAVVVGVGASPFHSALGAYENETHCKGWDDGRGPMPFVLVDDVAGAIVAALEAPLEDVAGKAFNLVGDVRWSARRYTEELARATGRPLKFHPSSVRLLYAEEWVKYAVKKMAGRSQIQAPSMRDLKSRGMRAQFDTSEEKRILNWRPCAEETAFRSTAILPHVKICP
jgi:predicted dehydrogenase/uncharacterized protein YbjT (DUF2867 family)